MDLKNPVDVEKAQEQWSALKLKIEKAGAKVKVMEPTVCLTLVVKSVCRIGR